MNERQITMRAIGYFGTVLHALQFEMYTKSISDDVPVLQAAMDCTDYIQQITKLDVDGGDLRARMILVADSMRWLLLKRGELDSVFVNSSPSIPSIEDLENLMGAASVKFA